MELTAQKGKGDREKRTSDRARTRDLRSITEFQPREPRRPAEILRPPSPQCTGHRCTSFGLAFELVVCIFTAALVCQGSDQDSQPDIPKPRCSPGQPTTQSENIKASYNVKESQSQSVCQIIIIYISLPSGIRPRVRLVSVKVYTYTCTVLVIHCSNSCSLPRGLCGLSQLIPLLAILGLLGCYFAAHGIYCLSPCHSPSSVFHPITCSKKHFSC